MQTIFAIADNPLLNPNDAWGFWGSCFSQEMALRFQQRGLSVWQHPHGTVFSSTAMREQLRALQRGHWDLVDTPDGLRSWQAAHKIIIQEERQDIERLRSDIASLDLLFITLGSAFTYYHNPSQIWAANCHKIDQRSFTKHLLSPEEIAQDLVEIRSHLHQLNPHLSVVWTLSPVRHLRDGISENARSKAHCLTALHKHLESSSDLYFPSYEIATEELRDHRHFAADLAHLNTEAVDYIFQRLCQSWGTEALNAKLH